MRIILVWAAALFVFGSFYAMVEKKEALRRNGQTIYLALAPVDPLCEFSMPVVPPCGLSLPTCAHEPDQRDRHSDDQGARSK